jgi:hypothetical protein
VVVTTGMQPSHTKSVENVKKEMTMTKKLIIKKPRIPLPKKGTKVIPSKKEYKREKVSTTFSCGPQPRCDECPAWRECMDEQEAL